MHVHTEEMLGRVIFGMVLIERVFFSFSLLVSEIRQKGKKVLKSCGRNSSIFMQQSLKIHSVTRTEENIPIEP